MTDGTDLTRKEALSKAAQVMAGVPHERVTAEPVGANAGLDAHCPHCERSEDFGDLLTAKAWLYGHITTEHADELPALENDE